MAELRNASRYAQKQQWANKYRERAQELIMDAMVLQNELFALGDLSSYLKMLARMPHQNARNLLLLMVRFPAASCLAGFRVWQNRLPDPSAPVLRPGQKGRGIELLVPFTDLSTNAISWYAVLHFDVSQVNVDYKATPVYISTNPSHHQTLLMALRSVLGEYYSISISTAEDSEDLEMLQTAGLKGRMLPGYFLLRPNLTEEEKLHWLTTSLCRLFLQNQEISPSLENYISICAAHCLFEIWGISSLSSIAPNETLISSIPTDARLALLDLLQRCVHTIDSQVSEPYRTATSLDEEIMAELGI